MAGESGEGVPLGSGGGESGEAALRVVAGASGAGGPSGSSFGGEFVIEAVLPPAGPEVFEPFLGVERGGFVKSGGEETSSAEEDGFAIFGRVLEEFLNGETLREEAHGEAVGGEAEGIGEGFPEGLGETVELGSLLEASGFKSGAVEGGFFEEGGDVALGHVSEWELAEAGAG